ncbi:aspartyl protease family protein 2-like [Chenopodium quinoa]|uniref:Peptidase A1 domain-containing protein n=1 Tax=Chenopodium quinoa TaxID=63459 RepID=A0A803LRL2_CHEQI|nr:aspartyl protease family protein 2-like [Chenopodium quinoa]XP_021735277.1 aspartyl protease family protein 2-like [Chenopodium quinoa]
MVSKAIYTAILVLISYLILASSSSIHDHNPFNSNGSLLEMPEHNFNTNVNVNTVISSGSGSGSGCSSSLSASQNHSNAESEERVVVSHENDEGKLEKLEKQPHLVKLPLRHRTVGEEGRKQSVIESTFRDFNRIQTFRRRITENKNQKANSRLQNHRQLLEEQPAKEPDVSVLQGHLVGSLKSGVSLGSGEYFMDVYVGTPPKHFSLIVDTGSDLNWIQCVPCYDCFEQNGPHYDPKDSLSFKNISCQDPRCDLVSSPDPPVPCKGRNQSCPYFYWYGDSSNTTGDFALETFTVNLTSPNGDSEFKKVDNVMFGCGHWNRGLFHGAAGLLGLGKGPLSFSSQLQSIYGHSFSYCLVDRNSDPSVSSKLIFGEDKDLLNHPELKFTKLVNGKDNPVDTFYYVEIKSVSVGGEMLNIPKEMWDFMEDGGGGTIVDSGTTLSYFVEPAYDVIKSAFMKKINKYPLVSDFPILSPCYNVSGVENNDLEMPSFRIQFSDGAEWNFPVQNYFIRIDQEVVCLAMMGTKRSAFSIIGNYQQQNFHMLYDTKRSRIGYAPTSCADV